MQICHNKPNFLGFHSENLLNTIASGMVAYGEQGQLFEDELCDFFKLPKGHAVLTTSGSVALFLALNAFDIKNKTVAIPSYVCSSLRNAISFAGAKEIIIDTEKKYPNINIEELNYVKPDFAIIPHMYGIPVDLDKIDKSITIIEDCAQSIGAKYKNQYTGTIAEIGILSFYATKLITTGEGGAIISKNKEIIDRIRDFLDFDCRNDKKIRFNFHMSDINAAIGREQLKLLPKFLERREEIFRMYKNIGLSLIEPNYNYCEPVRYRAILNVESPSTMQLKLENIGIKTIIPIEEYELLAKTKNAFELSKKTLSLPCYPLLKNEELQYIINSLEELC